MYTVSSTVMSDLLLLPNVNVREVDIHGNQIGNSTTTNNNGQFTLSVSSPDALVRLSHTGYDYDTYTAKEIADFDYIELWPSTNMIDDVTIQNNYKSSNLIWWILGFGILTTIGVALSNKKPARVQPKKVRP